MAMLLGSPAPSPLSTALNALDAFTHDERDVFFSSRAHPPEHPAAEAELSMAAASGAVAGAGRQQQQQQRAAHVASGCTKDTPRGCCPRHPEHPNCKG